jgi:MFS family permease
MSAIASKGSSLLFSRRAHAMVAAALFAGLGLHVGLWAVLIPDVAAACGLGPGALGACLALVAAVGAAALLVGGRLSDRRGRRPVAVAGAVTLAAAFVLLGLAMGVPVLLAGLALLGVGAGLLDVAANATGADYERAYRVRAMTALHAAFSAGAAAGALIATVVLAVRAGHRAAFLAGAAALAMLAAVMVRAPLPAPGVETPRAHGSPARLLAVPGVLLAVTLAGVCFFGDGVLEGFATLYLRDALGSGALLAGGTIAAFHLASLAGRLTGAAAIRRRGEAAVVRAAGLGMAAGMAVIVLTGSPALAAAGLLVVGASLAPVVPTALSVAARSVPPDRAGAAVSVVATAGYATFVVGPAAVGLLADVTSLRAGLVPLLLTAALIAALAQRLPTSQVIAEPHDGWHGAEPCAPHPSLPPPSRP